MHDEDVPLGSNVILILVAAHSISVLLIAQILEILATTKKLIYDFVVLTILELKAKKPGKLDETPTTASPTPVSNYRSLPQQLDTLPT